MPLPLVLLESDVEAGAATRLALYPGAAAVAFGDLLHDREANAGGRSKYLDRLDFLATLDSCDDIRRQVMCCDDFFILHFLKPETCRVRSNSSNSELR